MPVPVAAIRNIVLAVVAMCAIWPAVARVCDQASYNPRPVQLRALPATWAPAAAFSHWVPSYMPADAGFSGVWQQDGTPPVALTILYYRNQHRDKSLISSVNRLAGEKDSYHELGGAVRSEQVAGRTLTLRETRMRGPEGTFLLWHWMSIDGHELTNAYAGKLRQAGAKLLMHGDDGAAIMLSSPYTDDQDQSRRALRAFLDAHLMALESSLAAARSN
jgi:EpsI family protein